MTGIVLTSTTGPVVWLRPEFQGREDELINLSSGAAAVGVVRATVTNWANRHGDFPKVALVAGRSKFVVRREFFAFAEARASSAERSGPVRPAQARTRRARDTIAAAQVTHYEGVLAELARREAKQAEALERTRAAQKAARRKLAVAQDYLGIEVIDLD